MRWTLLLLTLLSLTLLCAFAAADPRSHYMIHCMGCHLNDGRGLPPEVPAFDNKLAILAAVSLYLNFVNLFLFLLRLLGGRR